MRSSPRTRESPAARAFSFGAPLPRYRLSLTVGNALQAYNGRVTVAMPGVRMERLYADCGELPSEGHCAAIIAADSEAELLEAAAKHAKDVHGHKDGPELRNALRQTFHQGSPPASHRH